MKFSPSGQRARLGVGSAPAGVHKPQAPRRLSCWCRPAATSGRPYAARRQSCPAATARHVSGEGEGERGGPVHAPKQVPPPCCPSGAVWAHDIQVACMRIIICMALTALVIYLLLWKAGACTGVRCTHHLRGARRLGQLHCGLLGGLLSAPLHGRCLRAAAPFTSRRPHRNRTDRADFI